MAEDRRLTTAPKAGLPQYPQRQDEASIDPSRALAEHYTFTAGDFYSAGSKRIPSARIVQAWAREQGLSSQIIDCGKDKERAWAHVRCWSGPKDNPILVREKYVIHLFSQLLTVSTFEAIANGLMVASQQAAYGGGRPRMERAYPEWEIVDNLPVLTNPQHQFQLLRNLLEKTRFAERDAISKAERAAFLELLGRDDDADDDAPAPAERTPEPKTLDEFRRAISSILRKQTSGDLPKATAALLVISEVAGEHKAVKSTLDITQLDHAEEIYRRLQAGEMAKKMADEPVDETFPDLVEPEGEGPRVA